MDVWLAERASLCFFQELLLDSDTIADKILKNQHFHKASQEEREQIVTGILAKGPAGALATKMAHAVADKHETYRQARHNWIALGAAMYSDCPDIYCTAHRCDEEASGYAH